VYLVAWCGWGWLPGRGATRTFTDESAALRLVKALSMLDFDVVVHEASVTAWRTMTAQEVER
jgi:hypothetical protein